MIACKINHVFQPENQNLIIEHSIEQICWYTHHCTVFRFEKIYFCHFIEVVGFVRHFADFVGENIDIKIPCFQHASEILIFVDQLFYLEKHHIDQHYDM